MRKICAKKKPVFLKISYDRYLNKINRAFKIKNSIRYNHTLYSSNIKHIISINKWKKNSDSIVLKMPQIFSLSERYEESMVFLQNIFCVLINDTYNLTIDYQDNQKIDLDASICMDVLVRDFIHYNKIALKFDKSIAQRRKIQAKNFKDLNESCRKLLYSVGIFKNLGITNMQFKDVSPFELITGVRDSKNTGAKNEIYNTQIVDYIKQCLLKVNRKLTSKVVTQLCNVIGEALSNAEEHSTTNRFYVIGYFKINENNDEGVFNFVIFNYGDTIHQKFKLSTNQPIVDRMKELSSKYTKWSLFRSKIFEEENLWTLYALQQGITSTSKYDWKKRGNGYINLIDNFFKLKGDGEKDNKSKMILVSGHTQILFDGEYKTQEVVRGKDQEIFKAMTFNNTGNIEEKPDEEYVKFVKSFFPGTLLGAKIYITKNQTQNI
ncbi:hypothetical protein AD998_01860 [bacterium 336/3]|nr:hypothetical protein AD998_01860 [bacterium 336/3]